MVTVPRLERSIEPAQAPSVRLSPAVPEAAFGAGFAAPAAEIGRLAQDIYQREYKRANELAVLDADAQLSSFSNSLLFDPQAGALNKLGKDSFGLPQSIMEEFDRKSGEIGGSLSNDDQKLVFQRLMQSRRRDVDRAIQRHVSRQRFIYDNEVTEASVSNERAAAISAGGEGDLERVSDSILRQNFSLATHARRTGKSAEWLKLAQTDAESKTHAGVIQTMLAQGDDLAAKKYFQENKKGLIAADLINSERAVEAGSIRGESQRKSDEIMSKLLGFEESLTEARKITDPKVRDETVRRVRERWEELRRARAEAENRSFREAANIVEKARTVDAIPSNIMSVLTPAQRTSLDARARHLRQGTEPVHDSKAWVEFKDLRPAELATLSREGLEVKYRHLFDNAHWDRAVNEWATARDARLGDDAARKAMSSIQSNKDIIENAFLRHVVPDDKRFFGPDGIYAFKKDALYVRRYTEFEDLVSREINSFEAKQKRSATAEERQKIANFLLSRKVYIEQWGKDPKVPAVLLTEAEKVKAYVPIDEIPLKDFKKIYRYALSIGVIRPSLSEAQFRSSLKSRIERAYAADMAGANRKEIDEILKGKR